MKIQKVAVIGSGTMGNGIAHVFAQYGYDVHLIDINEQALQKALQTISKNMDRQIAKNILTEQDKQQALNRIKTFTNIDNAVTDRDLIVEAATENPTIKLDIFKKIDALAPEHCILASNTSSISITKIAAVTKRPDKVIGMHFMNPVPMMKLVEIINGFKTSSTTNQVITETAKALQKVPVTVNDFPGFVSNKVLMPLINEAIYTLYEGIAGVEEIDTIMKLGMAHPMGPLQLADFIGLDVCLYIMRVLYEGYGNPKYAPCPLLVKMVDSGNLGVKSGMGFYDYSNKDSKELIVAPQFRKHNPVVV
ncbi:MAG: 3-hydroxybutyryl-CoA dehydrogenase [Bacteroidia bacterium]|nr:MAG: 3-hydroxybutyryl-CoA dehydrogenase [Bacteroidia bacterium]